MKEEYLPVMVMCQDLKGEMREGKKKEISRNLKLGKVEIPRFVQSLMENLEALLLEHQLLSELQSQKEIQ